MSSPGVQLSGGVYQRGSTGKYGWTLEAKLDDQSRSWDSGPILDTEEEANAALEARVSVLIQLVKTMFGPCKIVRTEYSDSPEPPLTPDVFSQGGKDPICV